MGSGGWGMRRRSSIPHSPFPIAHSETAEEEPRFSAMIKCPFCHYDNEDGALFCEQCKSALSTAAPAPPPVPVALVEPFGEDIPTAAPIVEPVPLEAVPMAEVHPADG